MGLGNNNGNERRIFLSVGFGRIRQKSLLSGEKVDANTPNAVKRLTPSGTDTWALEYDYVEGVIGGIIEKADSEYGDSFEVLIRDDENNYQLSFKADSQFWFDFAKRLPNLDVEKPCKLSAYDFTSKDGKRAIGFSVVQGGKKIDSFYQEKVGDVISNTNGYPSPEEGMNWKDKDERKMYSIKIKKFFKVEYENRFKQMFKTNPFASDPFAAPNSVTAQPATMAPNAQAAPVLNKTIDDDGLPF